MMDQQTDDSTDEESHFNFEFEKTTTPDLDPLLFVQQGSAGLGSVPDVQAGLHDAVGYGLHCQTVRICGIYPSSIPPSPRHLSLAETPSSSEANNHPPLLLQDDTEPPQNPTILTLTLTTSTPPPTSLATTPPIPPRQLHLQTQLPQQQQLPNRTPPHPLSPLHLASFSGHYNILTLLLHNGAEVNTPDEHGRTALHHAAQQGYTSIVELLLGWGADPCVLDVQGLSALHLAVGGGHEDVVRVLLVERGVDPNIGGAGGMAVGVGMMEMGVGGGSGMRSV